MVDIAWFTARINGSNWMLVFVSFFCIFSDISVQFDFWKVESTDEPLSSRFEGHNLLDLVWACTYKMQDEETSSVVYRG